MWLVEQSVRRAITRAEESGIKFSAEQQEIYAARFEAADTSRVMSIAGDKAEIHVNGALTNSPDIFAMFFGGGNTTYPEIISALAEADANPAVADIVMRFDSGGGSVNGMFDAMAAMQTTKKHITAIVGTMAASAAYGLASQADSIQASSRASVVGSIGIAAAVRVQDDVIDISSTHAPNKRPDVTTEAGKAVIVEELDAIHSLFAEGIAEGRGITVDTVNADFGKGSTLLADAALKAGMIDGIAQTALHSVKDTNTSTANISGEPPEAVMDLIELKAKHPALHAQVFELGVAEERDRVGAHLTMGAASGSLDIAVQAITDGVGMTATLNAKYIVAGMNRKDVADRQTDDIDAQGADHAASDDLTEEATQAAALEQAVAAEMGTGAVANV